MKRRAVIISNPGEIGADNYCKGVLRDVLNYRTFLLSPIGGAWSASEIVEMSRPTVLEVRLKMAASYAYDYVLIVFTGHGWHSTPIDSTILELRDGQELDSCDLRLPGRETLILDCCRVKHLGIPEVRKRALDEMLAKAASRFDAAQCRKYYDKRIQECADELTVMYACGTDQKANDDDQKGGVYSYNLLEACRDWAENWSGDLLREYQIMSVVDAHNRAERAVSVL